MCGLPLIGLGLTLATGAFRAIRQKQQYDQQTAQYKYQAKQAEEDAKVRRVDRAARRERFIRTQMNEIAAKGIDPLAGSPVDLYGDTVDQFRKEQADDDTEVKRTTGSLRLSRKNLRARGRDALWGGLLDTAAGAAGDRLDAYAKYGSFF